MFQHYRNLFILFSGISLVGTHSLKCTVDDITGDTGTPKSGSVTLSGGTSGLVVDSTTSTITAKINYVALPATTATNGQVIINSEPILHNFGISNANIFVGGSAGNFSTTGFNNTGCGASALAAVTSGNQNTSIGQASLASLTEGSNNTVVGTDAAQVITTGSNNIIIGQGSGAAYTTESGNIIVGTGNEGTVGETNVTRIGGGQTQTDCYIDGIYYATNQDPNTELPAFIDDQGKLGTVPSSAEFKNNIQNIGNDSAPMLNLRPVSYCLKSDKKKVKQFGLIAEEVNKIFPDLVVKDKKGAPYAVRYHELPALLLNELQKMAAHIEKLEARLQKLEKQSNH